MKILGLKHNIKATNDIFELVLGTPGNNCSIQGHTRTAIEINPLAITASQVAEQVAATALAAGRSDEINSNVSFAQLHVRARAVHNQLHAVQAHGNVSTAVMRLHYTQVKHQSWQNEPHGVPELFADFKANASVIGGNNSISKRHSFLARFLPDHSRQVKCLRFSQLQIRSTARLIYICQLEKNINLFYPLPGSEPSRLAVISIVTHHQFRANKQNCPAMNFMLCY
jgi:hypothetical protein